jgi:hypothetical protein
MGHSAFGAEARRPIHHRRPSSWPFKAPIAEHVAVTEQGVGVPRRQEVVFADGTSIWLHRVEHQGIPQLFLRDVGGPSAGATVDLRRLVPELATDLPVASTRDVPGLVHFSLRGRFQSAQQLLDAIGEPGRLV